MANSDIDIASKASVLCRANPISSFTEGSNEANIISMYYDGFIADIFGRYPWGFAKKKRRINQDSTAPVNEYQYSFQLPAEHLRLCAIYSSDAVGAKPLRGGWKRVGNFIFSNYPALWAEYTVYKPESEWPGTFEQYAIHALAALICVPLSDDNDRANELHIMAYGRDTENERGGKFGVAASADSQAEPPPETDANILIAARFS